MKVNWKNLKRWTSMALAWVLLFGTPSLETIDGDISVAMATEVEATEESTPEQVVTPEPKLSQDSQGGLQITPEPKENALVAATEAVAVPESTTVATAEATAEVTPEATAEATPETTAEMTPEATAEATPETTAEMTPEATAEATPEVTPEATAEATPEATPEATAEATAEATPEATAEATPEATVGVTPEAPLLAGVQEETIAVTVAGTDGTYGDEAVVTFDFENESTCEKYFSSLDIAVTRNGQPYNWQNSLAVYTTMSNGQYGIHFTEVGAYTVSVKVKDEEEASPSFAFNRDSIAVTVAKAPAPVTLELAQAEYTLDDTVRVQLSSTLEEGYRISKLKLTAVHKDGESVEFPESIEAPGEATLDLPKNAPVGQWSIKATCKIMAPDGGDVTENFADIAAVDFAVKSKNIGFILAGSYMNGQVYDGGRPLKAKFGYSCGDNSTRLTAEDVELFITRNDVAYTPAEGEVKGLTFFPRFAGRYQVNLQLADSTITGYSITAGTGYLTISQADAAYTAAVTPNELDPKETLSVTVNFTSGVAWSEMEGNSKNSGKVYLIRNNSRILWKTFEVAGIGEIDLQGPLPDEVGAGEWQVVVDIPIINQEADRSDNYQVPPSATIKVRGTEVFALEAKATAGQYPSSEGSVTFTAVEGVDLQSIVGFSVTRNGRPFEPGPNSSSSLVYAGNTVKFTTRYAGEYAITPYALRTDVTYTFECVGEVSVAKAPSPVSLTLDRALYPPGMDAVYILSALEVGMDEDDARNATVLVQTQTGEGWHPYYILQEKDIRTVFSAPKLDGEFEVWAKITGSNSEGIDLNSLYEDTVARARVSSSIVQLEIQTENNANGRTYAQAADGSAYVRFTAQAGISGEWVNAVELWLTVGVPVPFPLSDSSQYGRIVRDTSAGTITFYPRITGEYGVQLRLKEDADGYFMQISMNPARVEIAKASAPVSISVDGARTYYPGEKATIILSRQEVYDAFSSVSAYALDAQGAKHEIYQGTLDEPEIQAELNLPENAASGEWTIQVDFAMEDGGFDFAGNYEAVAPVAIEVGQSFRLSAQVSDGIYAGTATAAYAEFSWDGGAPDGWEKNVELKMTRDGEAFVPDGTNGRVEMIDTGFRFVPMVSGKFEVTPVATGEASYRLEAETARLSVSPAGIPAQAQVTKDATYYPGEDLKIRLSVFDGALGEGDRISKITVINEQGVILVSPVETVEDQKEYLLDSFVDYQESDGYVTYTIQLEISRDGKVVSGSYAPVEPVRFIVHRGPESPVVYLTAESQDGDFGDTRNRGAYVRFHAQTPDPALAEKIELRILRDGAEFVPDGTNGAIEYGEDFLAFYPECTGVFTVQPVVKRGVDCEVVASEADVSVDKGAAAVKAEMKDTVYRPGDTLQIQLSQVYVPVDEVSAEIQVYAMDANNVRHEIGKVAADALPQTLTLPLEENAPEGSWLIFVQWGMARDGADVSAGYATSVSIPIRVESKMEIVLEGTAVSGDICDALAGEAYVEYTSQSDVPLEELVSLEVWRDGKQFEVQNEVNCALTYTENTIRFSPWHAGEYEINLTLKEGVEGYTLRALSASLLVRKGDSLFTATTDRTQYRPEDRMIWTVQIDRSMEAYVTFRDVNVGIEYGNGTEIVKGSLEEEFLADPSINVYSEEKIVEGTYGEGQKAIVIEYRVIAPFGEDISDSFEAAEPARFVIAAEGVMMISLDAQVTDGNYLDIGTASAPKVMFVLPEALKDSGVPMDKIHLEISCDGEAYAPKDGAVVYGEDTVSFIPQTVGEYVVTPKLDEAAGFALLENPARLTVSKAPAPVTYSSEESVLPGDHFGVEYTVHEDRLAQGDAFDSIQIKPSYGSMAVSPYVSSMLQGVADFEVDSSEDIDSVKGSIEIRTTILRNGEDVSDCYETGYWPFIIESGTLRLTLADSELLPCKYVARFRAEDLMDGYSIEDFIDLRVFRDGELIEADGVQMVRNVDDLVQYNLALLWPGEYVIMPVLKDNASYRNLAFAEDMVKVMVSKAQNPVSRIEVENSALQVGDVVPVTVYLKDTLIDRGTGKDELVSLTVWASSEAGETTWPVMVILTPDEFESGKVTASLTLPEDEAALGAWTVHAQPEIKFPDHYMTSECYLESTVSARFTVEEREVTLGAEVSSGSYGSPGRSIRLYDEAGEFNMQNIELKILRNGDVFVPDGKNGMVEDTYGSITFYPYCVGEYVVTPVIKDGLAGGYRLNAQTYALSVTPSEPVVYVQPEYSAYRPDETIQAYVFVQYDALGMLEAYYGDRLESVQICATNGELVSDVVVIQAGDIDSNEPVPIVLPQGVQPGVWEIMVKPTILRNADYDASRNYEVHSESFELLEANQKIVRIERETDEIVGYWPLTIGYDVQISGENALSLEDLIEIYIENSDGPVEIDGTDVSVRYAQTSIEVTINREGEFWVCPYLKTDGDEYVLLPEDEFLREIWVEARRYEFPVEISYAEKEYVPGEIVSITLDEERELQSGHRVSEFSIWATNGEQRTDVVKLNDVSLPQEVELPLPEEAPLGEWTIEAVCKVVDSNGKDVTYQYENEQSGLPLSIGRQIRLDYYDGADGNYSKESAWGVEFVTSDCESQEELQEIVELEITRDGEPFAPNGTNGRVIYDFAGRKGHVIFETLVAGKFVVTPKLKDGLEKSCYLVSEAQTVNVTRAEAALELRSDASVYKPEGELAVSLENVHVVSGYAISDEIRSVKVWATNGNQSLKTQTFEAPLPETVVWTLPDDVQLGKWMVQAEVQVVREGTELDVSDCYEAIEPLQIQIVPKDTRILQLICDSAASGFAPGVAYYRANPVLAEDQLRQLVDMEITEGGKVIPVDGKKIALSYGDGEIAVEFRCSGTFTLTPRLKDGIADYILDASTQTLTLARQEAPVRAQIEDVYQPGDVVQVNLELNENCTAEMGTALQSFEVVLVAPDGASIRQSVEGPFSTGTAIAPVTLQLPADVQQGTWTLEIQANMGLYGDCVENFVPVQFVVTEEKVQLVRLGADSEDGDYQSYSPAYVEFVSKNVDNFDIHNVELEVTRNGEAFDASQYIHYSSKYIAFETYELGEYVVTPRLKQGIAGYMLLAEPVTICYPQVPSPMAMEAGGTYQPGDTVTVKLTEAGELADGDAITFIQVYAVNGDQSTEPKIIANPTLPETVTIELPDDAEEGLWKIYAKFQVFYYGDDYTQYYQEVEPAYITVMKSEQTAIVLIPQKQDGDYGQNNAWVTYAATDESIALKGKVVLNVLKDGNIFDIPNEMLVYGGNKVTFWPNAAGEYIVTPVKTPGQEEDYVVVAEATSFTVRKANAPLVMDVAEGECQAGEEVTVKLSQAATIEGDAIAGIQIFATNG